MSSPTQTEMEPVVSQHFHFLRQVGQNDLALSWIAERVSGGKVFLKISNADSGFGHETAKKLLERGWDVQSGLGSSCVLKAREKFREYDHVIIEYPYLDEQVWRPASSESLTAHWPSALLKICEALDYLHLLGLTHGDIKLSNFLVRNFGDRLTVKLVDLDFLCESGSSPQARTFGTPDHIAPEILSNRIVVAQSDNYSLGVALKAIGNNSEAAKLSEFLTVGDYLQRPSLLLPLLKKQGIIDSKDYQRTLKGLLLRLLITKRNQIDWHRLSTAARLAKFLSVEMKIVGLYAELVEAMATAIAEGDKRVARVFIQLILNSELDLIGGFWHISVPDAALNGLFSSLSRSDVTSKIESVDLNEQLYAGENLLSANKHLRAYLIFRRLADGNGSKFSEYSSEDQQRVLKNLAKAALAIGKIETVKWAYEHLLMQTDLDTQDRLAIQYRLCLLLGRQGSTADSRKIVEDAQNHFSSGNEYWRMRFHRAKLWLDMVQSKPEFQTAELEQVELHARELGFHDIEVEAIYTQAVHYWRSGDFVTAARLLSKAIEHGVAQGVDGSILLPATSTLAFIAAEMGNYESAIVSGKQAATLAQQTADATLLTHIFHTLVFAYTRTEQFDRAESWLQRYLAAFSGSDPSRHLGMYLQIDTFHKESRGDYTGATESGFRATETLSESLAKPLGKTYQELAIAALCMDDSSLFKSVLNAAHEKFKLLGDESSLTELKLLELIASHINGELTAITEIPGLVEQLVDAKALHYAALGSLYILISTKSVKELRDSIGEKRFAELRGKQNSIRRTIDRLALGSEEVKGSANYVSQWKESLIDLTQAGQSFLASLTAEAIGELYVQQGMRRHSLSFLELARRKAEELGNKKLSDRFAKRLEQLEVKDRSSKELIDSFLQVSQIVLSVGEYQRSLEKLVTFALRQTGAERGVLLLRTSGEKLKVAASVSCDEQSLQDIVDFSSGVAQQAAKSGTPVIIENALEDRRTHKYQSVIFHNILSAIALPLHNKTEMLGVLYLDHHLLTGLFQEGDVHYIQAIGNIIASLLATAEQYRQLRVTHRVLQEDMERLGESEVFLTQSPILYRLFDQLPQIAKSTAPILLIGESGTGKEVLAHTIHRISERAERPFVTINCAAIAPTLVESELFGVAKNTATGVAEREGKLEVADGGTLFLDEIGDMSLDVQAKLLRAVDNQEFERVGSRRTIRTDIRFLYATNKNLAEQVEVGKFRKDLWFRINMFTIQLPTLLERLEDIPLLAKHFAKLSARKARPTSFTAQAIDALMNYHWPGNIRELRNVVERCCILYSGQVVTVEQLPAEFQRKPGHHLKTGAAEIAAKNRLLEVYMRSGGNQLETARELQMAPTTLRRLLKKYKITSSNS